MKSARIYTNDLNRLIAATKSFVSDSDYRPCNQYIKLEFHAADNQAVAMAVDGYRMSVEHSVISDCDEDFVAFIKSNTKLPSKQYATISLTEDGKEAVIRCRGFSFGYTQPKDTPPNEWVSVEESLPEEKQRVIVRCERVGTSVGWILWGNWMTDIGPGAGKVTHWMPLPAPPGKDNNVPAKTPNEPLTQEDIDKMHFDRVWIDYGLDDSGERCGEDGVILYGKLYSIDTLDGSAFEDLLLNSCDGETLGRPSGDYTVYRRPPEVQS